MVDRTKKIAEGIGLVTLCYVGMGITIVKDRCQEAKERIFNRDKATKKTTR